MVNEVTLIGNLGKDPQFKKTESGTSVAAFSLATNESYTPTDSDEWVTKTEWHKVVAWRGLADRVERDLRKGKLVYVSGKLTHRSYDKDGETRYVTEVVASTIRVLEKKNGGSSMPNESAAPPVKGIETKTVDEPEPETASKDDDLPF